jgi:hypothetical protein
MLCLLEDEGNIFQGSLLCGLGRRIGLEESQGGRLLERAPITSKQSGNRF